MPRILFPVSTLAQFLGDELTPAAHPRVLLKNALCQAQHVIARQPEKTRLTLESVVERAKGSIISTSRDFPGGASASPVYIQF